MEFAQSRGDDDLFADEFEPAPEFTVIDEAPANVSSLASGTPVSEDKKAAQHIQAPAPSNNQNHKNHNHDRGGERRGGGRGRGGISRNGLKSSRYAPQEPEPVTASFTEPSSLGEPHADEEPDAAAPPPTEPPPQQNKPILSVRGDRSLTGGPSYKKLTEEELTAKLERMKVINVEKSESFRKSEKDREGYIEKEKEEKRKRQEEMKTRRLMEGERMKNRERKLKAMGGREWDEGKDERDFEDKKGRSSQYVRGGHGGVIRGRGGLAGSRFNDEGGKEGHKEVYENNRGRESGRGRGRGNGRGGKATAIQKLQTVPVPEDFPLLPPSSTSVNTANSDLKSPLAGAGDWADEMSTPTEKKKLEVL